MGLTSAQLNRVSARSTSLAFRLSKTAFHAPWSYCWTLSTWLPADCGRPHCSCYVLHVLHCTIGDPLSLPPPWFTHAAGQLPFIGAFLGFLFAMHASAVQVPAGGLSRAELNVPDSSSTQHAAVGILSSCHGCTVGDTSCVPAVWVRRRLIGAKHFSIAACYVVLARTVDVLSIIDYTGNVSGYTRCSCSGPLALK